MLSAIFKHFNWIISERRNQERFEARKKFEENLKAVTQSDSEEEIDENDNLTQEPVAELAWSCSKYEGNLSFNEG